MTGSDTIRSSDIAPLSSLMGHDGADSVAGGAVEDTGALSLAQSETDAVGDATETVSEADRLDALMLKWVRSQVHGSPISRNTEAYNHLMRSLPALRDLIIKGD